MQKLLTFYAMLLAGLGVYVWSLTSNFNVWYSFGALLCWLFFWFVALGTEKT